ncbi:MAG: betaine/proline/choline family ABC transporter ATP-binding protein [Anaerostipes sp.]|jgi:osmoprotectant transport system ATP-binding protein
MIELRNITKKFKDSIVIDDISMKIRDGELVAIIGSSGCGKTTTLKMINHLITPTRGKIFIDDVDIDTMDQVELRRGIGYVIQQSGLFPHMTVKDNIEIIQKLEKKSKEEIEESTSSLMDMVGLSDDFLYRYPTELSGGQQQRVGVARALANRPEIILMDEPFSALDPMTRISLQDELIALREKINTTIVFVTHDMDEAIKIADRICIMKDGKILQYDTPEEILRNPYNEYVENFVGINRIWDSPEYIKVEDIMIHTPVTCRDDFTRFRCIRRMRERNVDSLMVVSDDGTYEGIVSRRTLQRVSNLKLRVKDFMYTDRQTASPDENILDVLKIFDEKNVQNVPVTDENGKLVGLITGSTLIATLSQQYLTEEEREEEEGGTDYE